jgi:hypothetical protein
VPTSRKPRSQGVQPFWHRLPNFFLYPFQPRVLLVFAGLVAATAVTGTLPLIGAIVVSIVLSLFLTKYGLNILARTAEGRLDAPPLDGETLLQGYELPFKLMAIFIVMGVAAAFVATTFGWVVLIFVFLALFLLPASIMTLAFTGSLGQAIHPGELFRMVRATGWGYVALLGCLFLLNGGSSTALHWLGAELPPDQLVLLSSLLQYYFMFVMFHLMGYLLYQYHDRLGYQPDAIAEVADETDPERQVIQDFIDADNHSAAITELKRLVRRNPNDLELRMWLHRLARTAADDQTLLTHAGGLIEDLIDTGRVRDATEVYRACQDIDAEARPARAADYLPLARMMVDANEPDRALKLANGFHRNFPDSDETPRLYFLVAQIMADHRKQPEKACAVLDFISRNFPHASEARRAESLRSALAG